LTAVYTIDIPTQLTMGLFADGNIPTTTGVQWFKFTTEAGQTTVFIHLQRGPMTSGKVTLYENDRTTAIGTETTLGSTSYAQRTVTASTDYFIKVTPYTGSGTYRIAVVNATVGTTLPSITIPSTGVTDLPSDTWKDGNIANNGEENWYKLTSTGTAQNIFADLTTMLNLNAQLYDENGAAVGTEKLFGRGGFSPTGYTTSITVENNKVYYIRATHYSSGTYKIASTSGSSSTTTAPALTVPTTTATSMNADTWTNGNITTAGGEQWFKFNSTDTTQYIHLQLQLATGTLNDIIFQLVDSTGKAAGTGNLYNLSSSSFSISRTGLTASTDYYVRINPYSTTGSGTFKIGFNATQATPVVDTVPTTGIVNLTAINTYATGSITSTGVQWFKFTSSIPSDSYTNYQYIYFQSVTLTNVYALVYTNDGRLTGSRRMSYGLLNYDFVSPLEDTTVYYIKVTPYTTGSTGTYKLAYGTSSTVPTL